MLKLLTLAAPLALLGCASTSYTTSQIDTAVMPLTGGGTPVMSDAGAIGLASYSLGDQSRTRNNPQQGALAVAAVDFLAGELSTSPRWYSISSIGKDLMLRGRIEARSALGISPGASSTEVVGRLIQASGAGRDPQAAQLALASPVFTYGPARTYALLSNLPPLPTANWAAQTLNSETTTNCNYDNCK